MGTPPNWLIRETVANAHHLLSAIEIHLTRRQPAIGFGLGSARHGIDALHTGRIGAAAFEPQHRTREAQRLLPLSGHKARHSPAQRPQQQFTEMNAEYLLF